MSWRNTLCFALLAFATWEDSLAKPIRDQSEGRLLLQGMLAARQRLVSGRYHTEGGKVSTTYREKPADSLAGEIEIDCAFDADRLRFDQSRPSKKGPAISRYFHTKTRRCVFPARSNTINFIKFSEIPPGAVKTFDVRVLGMIDGISLKSGMTLDQAMRVLLECPFDAEVTSADVANGIKTITTYIPRGDTGPPGRTSIEIDVRRGYTPIKLEFFNEVGGRDGAEWVSNQLYETRWEQIKGTWAPVEYSMRNSTIMGETVETQEFRIVWTSVNEPIDNRLFTWESFEPSEMVAVMDMTMDQPVVLKHGSLRQPVRLPRPASNDWQWWALGGTCAAVAAIAYVLIQRQAA